MSLLLERVNDTRRASAEVATIIGTVVAVAAYLAPLNGAEHSASKDPGESVRRMEIDYQEHLRDGYKDPTPRVLRTSPQGDGQANSVGRKSDDGER